MSVKIRPGILVTLSTSIEGGIQYERIDLKAERADDGALIEEWETQKTTEDPEEYEEAVKVRQKVRSLVKSCCVWTPFGMICPHDEVANLDRAFREAAERVEAFNADAQTCRVVYRSLRGEIAEDQVESIQSIREHVGALVSEMQSALRDGDVASIRDCASQATQMGRLLEQDSDARGLLGRAVKAARSAAREIVRKVEKQGDSLVSVLNEANLSAVSQARFVFLEADALERPVSPKLDATEYDDNSDEQDVIPAVNAGRYAGLSADAEPAEPEAGEEEGGAA